MELFNAPAKKRLAAAVASDKTRVMHPDFKTPFISYDDVWQRLLAYHLYSDNEEYKDEPLWRNKFVDQTKSFHQRFQNLADTFNKNLQQIQENPFEEERILIDKLSMYQEKILIDQALKNQTNKIENK